MNSVYLNHWFKNAGREKKQARAKTGKGPPPGGPFVTEGGVQGPSILEPAFSLRPGGF